MKFTLISSALSLVALAQAASASLVDTSNKWPNPENIPVCWQIEELQKLSDFSPKLSVINDLDQLMMMDAEQLVTILSLEPSEENLDKIENERFLFQTILGYEQGTQAIKPYISIYKEKIKEMAINEYHKKTNIRFTGWNDCTEQDKQSTNNIRINIVGLYFGNGKYQVTGAYSGIGQPSTELKGKPTLSITVSPEINEKTELAVKGSVIHELGHALGLQHEHDRVDAQDCKYSKLTEPTISNTPSSYGGNYRYVGPYDSRSVMNYCSDGTELTNGDVQGLQYLYPESTQSKAVKCAINPASNYKETGFNYKGWCNGFKNQNACESAKKQDITLCKWTTSN